MTIILPTTLYYCVYCVRPRGLTSPLGRLKRILYPLQQSLHLHQPTYASRHRRLHTQRGQGVAIFYTRPLPNIPLPTARRRVRLWKSCLHASSSLRLKHPSDFTALGINTFVTAVSSSFTTTARRGGCGGRGRVFDACACARAPPSPYYVWVRRSDCRGGRRTDDTGDTHRHTSGKY